METLLACLNVRTFAAAAVLAALVYLGVTFQKHPRNWYHRIMYTSQTEKTSLAATIERDLEAKASLKLRALHREVSQEISQSVAEGFAVGSLQQAADDLLQLDTPALRSEAVDRLQRLRLSIPKKKTRLRVATDEDDDEEIVTPRVRSAGPARARRR